MIKDSISALFLDYCSRGLRRSPKTNSIRIFYKKRGRLYSEGEKLKNAYILVDGKVSLTRKDPEGQKVFLPHVNKGDFLAIPALLSFHTSSHSAVVVKPSTFLSVPIRLFSELLRTQPALRLKLTRQLIFQLDGIERQTDD